MPEIQAMSRKKITLPYLFKKVADGSPITWLTCYDYPTAYLQEQAGIEMILVGDSLGMTMLGYDSSARCPYCFCGWRYALHDLPTLN
jgi:3-methyl-2-oxobutanoate hydroxymethyltransferase